MQRGQWHEICWLPIDFLINKIFGKNMYCKDVPVYFKNDWVALVRKRLMYKNIKGLKRIPESRQCFLCLKLRDSNQLLYFLAIHIPWWPSHNELYTLLRPYFVFLLLFLCFKTTIFPKCCVGSTANFFLPLQNQPEI